MKLYQAVYGSGDLPITTVLAETEEEARAEVVRQLEKNEGRQDWLLVWQAEGQRVREKE